MQEWFVKLKKLSRTCSRLDSFSERDSLRRSLQELESKTAQDLQAAAQSAQAEIGVSARLIGEMNGLNTKLQTMTAEMK